MVGEGGLDGQIRVLEEHRTRPVGLIDRRLGEPPGAFQRRRAEPARQDVVDPQADLLEREILVLVALDPVVDLADRPVRAVDVERLVLVQVRPDDPVQADEVIDVVVRDEDRLQVAEPLHVQPAVVPRVEQQGVVSPRVVDVQPRVAGRAVDQADFGGGMGLGHDLSRTRVRRAAVVRIQRGASHKVKVPPGATMARTLPLDENVTWLETT